MTVGSTESVITVQGNGITSTFSYPFEIPAASDAVVIYTAADGTQTTLLSTQYTITGLGLSTGGTVTYPLTGSPIASGTYLTIQRLLPLVQTTSIQNQGPTFASIENEFDYQMMVAQQLQEQLTRTIQLNVADINPLPELPPATQRANQILGFDGSGNPIVAQPSSALVSSAMQPVVNAATRQLAVSLLQALMEFTSIAALRANTLAPPAAVYVAGYATGADGGEGVFWFNASDTTTADNGGTIIVDGSGNRWYRGFDRATWSVKWFGAKLDGVTNDTTAILNTVAAVGAYGGGTVWFPASTSPALLSQTIVLSKPGVKLLGPWGAGNHDAGPQQAGPGMIKWVGTVGGTMCQIKSATITYPTGNNIAGLFWDGNTGTAGIGVQIMGHRRGVFDIHGAHFSTAVLQLDPDPSLSEPYSPTENLFLCVEGYQTNDTDGSIVIENSDALYNANFNSYLLIVGDFKNSAAVLVNGSDSETFFKIKLFRVPGGSGVGLAFKGGPSALQAARNNVVLFCGTGAGGVFAEGTSFAAFPSSQNNIMFLDTANAPIDPVVDTAATLWWGTDQAPVGFRSSTVSSSALDQTDASGIRTISGTTGTITPGSTATVSFSPAFGTAVISANATAKVTPSAASADASTSTLSILNDPGGATTSFHWEVRGF